MHTRLIRFRHNTNQVSLAAAGLPHQEAKETYGTAIQRAPGAAQAGGLR